MARNAVQKAVVIAAPSSGSGKTLITLAVLRALKNIGIDVGGAKAGPDYIDPAFHNFAVGKSGTSSINLDPWAMQQDRLRQLANDQSCELLIVEAMMGLFDGAADGTGSVADLAVTLQAPVILVVDAAKQSHSIAALCEGFARHRSDINIAGVILNKVGSDRHELILRDALSKIQMQVLGAVHRNDNLVLPERHLGLVQAGELKDIETFVSKAADIIAASCDLDAIAKCSKVLALANAAQRIPVLGQHIAIAKDKAFSFIYPHLLADWRARGAETTFFSPLADEAPDQSATAIYLPGGYPELHAAIIANAEIFKTGMLDAAARDVLIYGECGGYMVLGDAIECTDGSAHQMLGLLNLETSFAKRKLHLGYRNITTLSTFPLGESFKAHEFHYTSAIREEGAPLFEVEDALHEKLGTAGLRKGNVMGSYMHIIDGVQV